MGNAANHSSRHAGLQPSNEHGIAMALDSNLHLIRGFQILQSGSCSICAVGMVEAETICDFFLFFTSSTICAYGN